MSDDEWTDPWTEQSASGPPDRSWVEFGTHGDYAGVLLALLAITAPAVLLLIVFLGACQ